MGKSGRLRWNPFNHRSSSSSSSSRQQEQQPPVEFLCPISKSIMSDPVVVSSGQTFERVCVQVCRDLGFAPKLDDDDDSRPDFSTIIPNLNMKSTIDSWCDSVGAERPQPPDYSAVERNLRQQIPADVEIRVSEQELLRAVADRAPMMIHHADSELMGRRKPAGDFNSTSSSDESVIVAQSPFTPLPLTTRPACFSPSSSSSEIETNFLAPPSTSAAANAPEEEEIYDKLTSSDIFDQEQGLIMMRKMTRTKDDARVSLCSPRILSLLKNMIVSRYSLVQTNSLASLVNLSLEKQNKLTIVRLGFVPILIDVLKSGSREAQEHAAGSIFSLSLEDDNKMPIGVLGALQPLLHALRASESDRTRHDSALALYHLSLNLTNRSKLVRLGAVPALFSLVRSGESASRALLVICNLACCSEGRSAMLDANAVAILVGKLREESPESTEARSSSARENCVAALFALSHESLRFKGLAKEARAVEVLKEVEERGTERAREKAKKILQLMRERVPEEDEEDGEESIDWDRVIDSTGSIRSRFRIGRNRIVTQNSSGFLSLN
uniref:RING-type E3 ubiquitin transferase n=1 Tax=Noccaea caerulescens TaxID=107243 RepID=A0A1J3CGY5_NOCCA